MGTRPEHRLLRFSRLQSQTLEYDRSEVVRDPFGHVLVLSFDHHPHHRLGAGGAQQHSSAVAQELLRRLHGIRDHGVGGQAVVVDNLNFVFEQVRPVFSVSAEEVALDGAEI